jgi:poly(hydroxyalkanoate) granule-associated protein
MATRKTTKKTTSSKTTRKPASPATAGKVVKDSASKIWLAGLGAFALAEEEGGKLFHNLIDKGKEFEETGRQQLDKAREKVEELAENARERFESATEDVRERAGSTWDRVEKRWDERTARTLKRLGVPTRDEIGKLTRRIEELTRLVERKVAARPAAPRRKAPRPATRQAS